MLCKTNDWFLHETRHWANMGQEGCKFEITFLLL